MNWRGTTDDSDLDSRRDLFGIGAPCTTDRKVWATPIAQNRFTAWTLGAAIGNHRHDHSYDLLRCNALGVPYKDIN